mgnify:CR=1 FL=1
MTEIPIPSGSPPPYRSDMSAEVFVVLGMHKSGTTLVSQILHRSGIEMGDADDVVPVAENTAILEARYKQLGGQITVIHKPGVGHHPHSRKRRGPNVADVSL